MPQATPTFRIFVSSTFTDLVEERNALHRTVFPALKQLCEEHQARFQAIDLRWGVREEAALDQQTMRICLDEVKRCQDITPRPNFLILLGERYGWRPLPPVIPAEEFTELYGVFNTLDPGEVVTAAVSSYLLDSWYLRDDNVPPEYRLKPRVLREGQTPEEEAEEWLETETRLREVLADAAVEAHAPRWLVDIPGGFMFSQLRDPDRAEEERLKYEMSATEREIQNGALAVSDASEHVFCFFRTIEDLPNDATAEGYRDLIPDRDRPGRLSVDSESDRYLERLKGTAGQLRQKLPEANFREYQAQWLSLPDQLTQEDWTVLHGELAKHIEAARARNENQTATKLEHLGTFVTEWYQPGPDSLFHLSPQFEALDPDERVEVERKLRRAVFHEQRPPITTNHLAELCRDVQQALSDVILRQIQKAQEEKERERRTDLDEEIATHERFAAEQLHSKRDPTRSIFVGRAASLRRISDYLANIANDAPEGRIQPLALVGEPGSGKSSVMAQAVEETRKAHPNALVISRFIGWTPGSAVVRDLLDKLCRQIAKEYGLEEGTPSDYRELVQEFPKRLRLASEKQPSRPLIIFLDALDQLTDADNARNLVWLPMELPAWVRLVVSTSTEPGDTEAVLKRRLAEENRFSLDEMPVEEADQLLRHWFDDARRTLQGRAESYADSTGQ
ncbi:MAG: DUF4062 domain-containing protein [Gemmatimonadales bacterium]